MYVCVLVVVLGSSAKEELCSWCQLSDRLLRCFNGRGQRSVGMSSDIHHTEWSQRYSSLKPGFHYPSWRPKLTGDRFPLPFNTGRVDGPSTRLVETRACQHGNGTSHPSTWVMETGLYFHWHFTIHKLHSYQTVLRVWEIDLKACDCDMCQ